MFNKNLKTAYKIDLNFLVNMWLKNYQNDGFYCYGNVMLIGFNCICSSRNNDVFNQIQILIPTSMQTMIIEAVKNGVLDQRLNSFNEFSDADAIILLIGPIL